MYTGLLTHCKHKLPQKPEIQEALLRLSEEEVRESLMQLDTSSSAGTRDSSEVRLRIPEVPRKPHTLALCHVIPLCVTHATLAVLGMLRIWWQKCKPTL